MCALHKFAKQRTVSR